MEYWRWSRGRSWRSSGSRLKCRHSGDTTVDDAGIADREIGRVGRHDHDRRSLTRLNLGAVGGLERECDNVARSVAVCSDREDCTGRERSNGVATGGGPGGPGPTNLKVDVGFTSDRVAGWLPATAAVGGRRVEDHLIVEIKRSRTGFPVNSRNQRAAMSARAGSERR